MNIRKLLDWRKLLIYTHRWMGIFFGIVFVVWFVSGVVFVYVGMPALSARERLGHIKPLDLSTVRISPAEAAKRHDLDPGSHRAAPGRDLSVRRFSLASGSPAIPPD